jgi:hypothetical protein
MVESIYFLKPARCGTHLAGLWPEQGLQPVTNAAALRAVVFTEVRNSLTYCAFSCSHARSGTVVDSAQIR